MARLSLEAVRNPVLCDWLHFETSTVAYAAGTALLRQAVKDTSNNWPTRI